MAKANVRIKPGDIVYLKSGSPKMTVCYNVGEEEQRGITAFECMWFDNAQMLQSDHFPENVLEIVSGG